MRVWYVTFPFGGVFIHDCVLRVKLTSMYRNHSRKKLIPVQLLLLPPRPPRATQYQLARNARPLSHHSVATTHRQTFESECFHQSPMRLSDLHRPVAPDRPAQLCPHALILASTL